MALRTYVQLSLRERDRIAVYRAQGYSVREIARRLNRDKGTISRELRRNRAAIYDAYGGGSAHRRARTRKRASGRRPRLKCAKLRTFVRRHVMLGWSPEQISGYLAKRRNGLRISTEAIYQYLYLPSIRRQENLVPYLARAHRRRQPKGHRHTHRDPHIPGRISILCRPRRIDQRRQYGHWERDSMETHKGRSGLSVLVERKSRMVKISKVRARTARNISKATIRRLARYPKGLRRSVTYDNGQENVEHSRVNTILGTRSYFCEPYHSWEKGTVENTIGIIRRELPKSTNFDLVSERHIKIIERRMNNRPRKVLHFNTPNEIMRRGVALQH